MAGPSILVRVLGDLTGFAKSATDAGSAASSAASKMHTVFSGVLGSLNQTGVLGPFGAALDGIDQALDQIGKHGKDVGLAMIGVGGAMAGIGVGLAALGSKDQAAHQQLQQAVEATGASYDDYSAKVDEAIKHNEHFGQTAVSTQDALRILTQATHDPQKALDLLSTATDVAAAKHEDLGTAATQLGRVYNGNTKLLKEFGITIDKSTGQTKNGQTAMQALAGVVGGQASAAADTFTGKMKALGASVEDRTAEFGQRFGPAITAAGAAVTGLGAVMSIASTALTAMQTAALGTRIELMALATWQRLVTVAQWLWNAAMDANPLMLVVLAVAALVAGIIYLATQTRVFQTMWQAFSAAMVAAFNWVKSVILDVFNWVAHNWPLLLAILTGPIGIAVYVIVNYWNQILNGLAAVWNWIRGTWASVYSILVSPIVSAAGAVVSAWNSVISFFAGLPGAILRAIGDLGGLLYGAGQAVVQGFLNGIGSLAGAVADKIKSVVTAPINAAKSVLGIGSPSTVFAQMGRDTVQGYINGIAQMSGAVQPAIAAAMPAIPSLSSAGGSAAGGGATTVAAGPAVHIENATFTDDADLEMLMRKTAWAVRTGQT